jgi:lysophospholipase L1-like esterase
VGDSQTQYGNGADSYFDYIKNRTGIAGANYGIGGTGYIAGGANSFYNRVQLLPTDLDIITVMGFLNDVGETLGTMSDRVSTTFYGAVHLTLLYLMENNIGKKIGVICNAGLLDSESRLTYKAAFEEVVKYYRLPYLDLWYEGGINQMTATLKEAYIPDAYHPNSLGREMISRPIEAFLKRLW